MGPPPTPRTRPRARAAAFFGLLTAAFLGHTILGGLRGQLGSSGAAPWASTQTMSDAEIEEVCQKYAVPDPPAYRPQKAALAAQLVRQMATGGGLYAFIGNKTFTGLMAGLTLEERERMALEAETVRHGRMPVTLRALPAVLGAPARLVAWSYGLAQHAHLAPVALRCP